MSPRRWTSGIHRAPQEEELTRIPFEFRPVCALVALTIGCATAPASTDALTAAASPPVVDRGAPMIPLAPSAAAPAAAEAIDPPPPFEPERPTLARVRGGCRRGPTHQLSGGDAILRSRGSAIALDADGHGGLLAFGSERDGVSVVPIDAEGRERGDVRTLTVRRHASELALQRVDERFLLIASGRCHGGMHRCLYGFVLDTEGRPVGDPALLTHYPGHELARALPLADRAPRRLWMVGDAVTGNSTGRQNYRYAVSLAEVDGVATFGSERTYHVPGGSLEVGYVGDHLASAVEGEVHVLYGWRAGTYWGPLRRGRSFDGDTVAGFRGAVRDLVISEGEAHVMLQDRSGAFFAARLPDLEPRTPVTEDGPLPEPFRDRVHASLSSDGELELRDSRGQRVDSVPMEPRARALTFTGRRFLVAGRARGRGVEVTSVECGQREEPSP